MQKRFVNRRGLIVATACLVTGGAIFAEAAAVAPVQQLVDGLLQVMKAGSGTPFQQRFTTLAPVIDNTFDLQAILQASIGTYWGTMSADEHAMVAEAFRRYTIASYVNSFDGFNGQRFEVNPDTRAVGAQQVVETKIIPKSGDTHALDYVMREVPGGWRVVDVLAEGSISRVAVQRSDFRRLLARGGAQALADSLTAKSTNLSAGSN